MSLLAAAAVAANLVTSRFRCRRRAPANKTPPINLSAARLSSNWQKSNAVDTAAAAAEASLLINRPSRDLLLAGAGRLACQRRRGKIIPRLMRRCLFACVLRLAPKWPRLGSTRLASIQFDSMRRAKIARECCASALGNLIVLQWRPEEAPAAARPGSARLGRESIAESKANPSPPGTAVVAAARARARASSYVSRRRGRRLEAAAASCELLGRLALAALEARRPLIETCSAPLSYISASGRHILNWRPAVQPATHRCRPIIFTAIERRAGRNSLLTTIGHYNQRVRNSARARSLALLGGAGLLSGSGGRSMQSSAGWLAGWQLACQLASELA